VRVVGITHVALELSSPTRMERYLHDVFGMQLIRQGYWKGEYVRVMGSPGHQRENPAMLVLYNRPFISRGGLRHIGLAVDQDLDTAVPDLRRRGYEVDGEDIITGPGGLRVKIDHFTKPRPLPEHDPVTKMADSPIDPKRQCLWRRLHHIALEDADPPATLKWMAEVFGMDYERNHDRRGEMISQVYYSDATPDAIGRSMSVFPLFLRRGIPRTELNHIAFDTADCQAAIGIIESRGEKLDYPQDAVIHGPEEVWYQIDSRDTPFPINHEANQTGVTLIPYHNR
jgi:catechol 2,3-dioxygenase-like lactoylglutathione lyase family enzyme